MQWVKGPPETLLGINYNAIIGMDPKANWLFGPGLQDYLPPLGDTGSDGRLIPFLIRFTLHDQAKEFQGILNNLVQRKSQIFVPDLYKSWLIDDRFSRRTFVAIATKRFFDQVADLSKADPALIEDLGKFQQADKRIRLSDPLMSLSLKPDDDISFLAEQSSFLPVSPPPREWPPETVVMATIDDGLPIANERFRERHPSGPPNPDQSRVQFLWCMPPVDPALPVGKEFAKDDGTIPGELGIDTHLHDSSTSGVIDEDDFYRRTGLIDLGAPIRHQATARRASHGAHVLDLTAGEDPGDPGGSTRGARSPIIGVQLPVSTVEDTSGSHLEAQIVLALDYIIQRADAIAQAQPGAPPDAQLPIVVNCSYGFIAGSHDGKSALELAMDERIQDRAGKLRIVLPAGNSNLSRCHATFDLEPTETKELRWRVQPDDRTPSFVEIWLPQGFDPASLPARVHLSVETPSGLASSEPPFSLELEEGNVAEILILKDDDDAVLAQAAYAFRPPVDPSDPPTEGRGMFCVALQPTARLQPTSDPTAESGVWTISLHNQDLLDAGQNIHAWAQRDDTPFGYPIRGRQSYFDEFCYQRFSETETPIGEAISRDNHPDQDSSCHIKRAGLINAIATGTKTVVVGGYVKEKREPTHSDDPELADYSAGGTPSVSIRGPDIAAISDDSRVHIGVMATGTRSSSKIALNGTSVAAPKIARLIAQHFAPGSILPGRPEVCLLATVPLVPPERAGCGGVPDEDIEGLPIVRRP